MEPVFVSKISAIDHKTLHLTNQQSFNFRESDEFCWGKEIRRKVIY